MLAGIFVIFFGFLGFLLSLYIRHKKTHKETHMVCPLKGDCKQVIYSEYSKFFGLPVEGLGLVYYGAVGVCYALVVLLPSEFAWLPIWFLPLTITASLFSLYLTFVQLFQIRQICTWCLSSAVLCFGIFVSAFIPAQAEVIGFLATQQDWVIIVHVTAAAVGLGAATLTDIFFFRFLKDLRIGEFEAGILRTLSQVIWMALAVILVSGLGMYLPQAELFNHDPKFLVKMMGLFVIIVNGAVLNLVIAPKLVKISFGKGNTQQSPELLRARRLAFLCGPISLFSWYAVFILGLLNVSLMFGQWLVMYAALLVLAVVAGETAYRLVNRRTEAR